MGELRILTVNEDGGFSDRMTATQSSHLPNANFSLKISIDTERKLSMLVTSNVMPARQVLDFPKLDIDGLIDYLQQVKTFISEEDMVVALRGKQPNAFYAKKK
jgi:hypothetical protein